MNAIAQLSGAQAVYDARLSDRRDDAAQSWLDDQAARLMAGLDVAIYRRGKETIHVRYDQLIFALDEHIRRRLAAGEVDLGTLGELALTAGKRGDRDELLVSLLGRSQHPDGMRYEIAVNLLEPHVNAGLQAVAEENEE
ncbi:hypothetical protein [Pseudomonas typographi]|uniref:hypothetical protein n=1 Tax=Pseudomonas typographi TaxID=2715964 RepID=UPI00168A3CC2|nr:hypothetical protein [Pseudomonas typographi]MBD1590331.1 hypothetical protein [Pseudomonas typographi]